MNHQISTNPQPDNILSFAQLWLQNNVHRFGQEGASTNASHRALYERACLIADQLEEERGDYTTSVRR